MIARVSIQVMAFMFAPHEVALRAEDGVPVIDEIAAEMRPRDAINNKRHRVPGT